MKKFNKDRVKKAQYGLKFDYDINKPISNMNAGMDDVDRRFLRNAAFSNYNGFKLPWGNVGFATYAKSEEPVKTDAAPIMDKLMQVNRNNENATDVLNDLLNQPYKEVVGTGKGSGSESDARELDGVEVTAPALIKKPQAPSVKLNIPKPDLTAPKPFDENANRRHLDLLRQKVYRKGILGYNGLTDEGKKFHGYVQSLLKDKDLATTNVEDILKGDDLLTWKILHGDKGFADANFNGWDGKVGQLDDDLQSWKDRYMKSLSPAEKPVVESVKAEAPAVAPAVEPEGAAEPNQTVTATTRRSGRGSTKSAAQLQPESVKPEDKTQSGARKANGVLGYIEWKYGKKPDAVLGYDEWSGKKPKAYNTWKNNK